MPDVVVIDREKLANEVKSKSNTLIHHLNGRPYNHQGTRSAVIALRLTLDKIIPPRRGWGFWTGLGIGLVCGLGFWYAFAHNFIILPH